MEVQTSNTNDSIHSALIRGGALFALACVFMPANVLGQQIGKTSLFPASATSSQFVVQDGRDSRLEDVLLQQVGIGAEDLSRSVVEDTTLQKYNLHRELAEEGGYADDFDADEGQRAASRAMTIELMEGAEAVFGSSQVREQYYAVRSSLQSVQDAMTVGVGRDAEGRLQASKEDEPLAELELTANMRDGIRPQLAIGESLKAQYKPSDNSVWLKLEYNF